MPAVVAGDPHSCGPSDQPARFGVGRVLLAHVHAVAIELGRKVRTVVEDDRDASVLSHGRERLHRAPDLIVGNALETDLQGGDIASIQRVLELAREGVEVGRAAG
jgi:hypothetical protein